MNLIIFLVALPQNSKWFDFISANELPVHKSKLWHFIMTYIMLWMDWFSDDIAAESCNGIVTVNRLKIFYQENVKMWCFSLNLAIRSIKTIAYMFCHPTISHSSDFLNYDYLLYFGVLFINNDHPVWHWHGFRGWISTY